MRPLLLVISLGFIGACTGDRHYVYELTGRRPERSVRVTIRQDTLTRLELPPIASVARVHPLHKSIPLA